MNSRRQRVITCLSTYSRPWGYLLKRMSSSCWSDWHWFVLPNLSWIKFSAASSRPVRSCSSLALSMYPSSCHYITTLVRWYISIAATPYFKLFNRPKNVFKLCFCACGYDCTGGRDQANIMSATVDELILYYASNKTAQQFLNCLI